MLLSHGVWCQGYPSSSLRQHAPLLECGVGSAARVDSRRARCSHHSHGMDPAATRYSPAPMEQAQHNDKAMRLLTCTRHCLPLHISLLLVLLLDQRLLAVHACLITSACVPAETRPGCMKAQSNNQANCFSRDVEAGTGPDSLLHQVCIKCRICSICMACRLSGFFEQKQLPGLHLLPVGPMLHCWPGCISRLIDHLSLMHTCRGNR